MTSASRFTFKNLMGFFRKSEDSLSHPSQLLEHGGLGALIGRMNPTLASSVATVTTCVGVLSKSVSSVPLQLMRKTDKGSDKATDHELYKLLYLSPCRGMTSYTWRRMLQSHLSLRGQFFCLKVKSRRRIVELLPLHPDRMRVEVEAGEKVFHYTNTNGAIKTYSTDDIWHVVENTIDGYRGASVIDMARESFEIANDAQKYARQVLRQGGAPSIALEHPGRLKQDTRDALKQNWIDRNSGPANAGMPLLLEEGLKIGNVGMSLEQLQFLETRKYQRTEICALFSVPPHFAGDLERATFSNIEHQALEFVMYAIRPIAVCWEQSLQADVLSWYNDDSLYAKFELSALLRGDLKTRYESYKSGIDSGWLTRNEAREMEDRNKLPGLDEPLSPLNMKGRGKNEKPPQDPPPV